MGIGAKLKELREGRGYTRRKLGELAAIPPGTIANIEYETTEFPTFDHIHKLIQALGYPLAVLEGQEKPRKLNRKEESQLKSLIRQMKSLVETAEKLLGGD